jgi:hypothetical protein
MNDKDQTRMDATMRRALEIRCLLDGIHTPSHQRADAGALDKTRWCVASLLLDISQEKCHVYGSIATHMPKRDEGIDANTPKATLAALVADATTDADGNTVPLDVECHRNLHEQVTRICEKGTEPFDSLYKATVLAIEGHVEATAKATEDALWEIANRCVHNDPTLKKTFADTQRLAEAMKRTMGNTPIPEDVLQLANADEANDALKLAVFMSTFNRHIAYGYGNTISVLPTDAQDGRIIATGDVVDICIRVNVGKPYANTIWLSPYDLAAPTLEPDCTPSHKLWYQTTVQSMRYTIAQRADNDA